MTVEKLLQWGKSELVVLGPEEASASAEVLLSEVLSLPRISLYLEARQSVSNDKALIFESLIAKRKQRVPTAYLTGKACFWNETLNVGPGCLIPRPETETLVQTFIDHSGFPQNSSFEFLDLGAGSGAIGIALLRHFPNARAVFADKSPEALAIAKSNIERYDLGSRAQLIQSDLFQNFPYFLWDVILSNPPYFEQADWSHVEPEVLQEPRTALDGGQDGLFFYRVISSEARKHLKPKGWLLVEVGRGQAKKVESIFLSEGFSGTQIFKDDLNIERVVTARWTAHG